MYETFRSVVRFRSLELDAVERRLRGAATIEDLRRIAKRRLPAGVFDYYDGGAEDDAVDVRFESRVGGRVVEIARDGSECNWADVIAWDPPHRVGLAWHPNPEPAAATIVDVRFTTVDGGTQVDLEHRAFEELGDDDGPAARAGYDEGWGPVIDDFVAAAG